MRHVELVRLQLPTALAPYAPASHQAGIGENVQVFRDRLARESTAAGQPRDGLWPALAEAGHQFEARLISQSGEGLSRTIVADFLLGRHGFWRT